MRAIAVAILILTGNARANPYPDLVWLCDEDVVRGRVLQDVDGEDLTIEIPGGEVWHLHRDSVCRVQRGVNKNVRNPPPTAKSRRTDLHASAIVLAAFSGAALVIGGVLLSPPPTKQKYPYIPLPQPFPPSYREAGGIVLGGAILVGIVAATLAGVAR